MIRIADHKNCDWQIRSFGEVGKEKTETSEKDHHYLKLNLPQLRVSKKERNPEEEMMKHYFKRKVDCHQELVSAVARTVKDDIYWLCAHLSLKWVACNLFHN